MFILVVTLDFRVKVMLLVFDYSFISYRLAEKTQFSWATQFIWKVKMLFDDFLIYIYKIRHLDCFNREE